ncbi:MAG TPA: cupin domain-containing protein [Paucimonas sp.]|nr:cupin domain-containing protein [Paucimonas sp.]HJW55917.1 cupin domain-containing protein [Burkholderiaceae bacterium]
MKKLELLGGLPPARFLREYWHKKPLLIRQAFPGLTPPLSRDALFALATGGDAKSQLITHFGQQWHTQSGPFGQLPSPRKKEWALQVHDVNLHDDGADALVRKFRFLPDARLDGLLISYATDAGGIGPHIDSGDIFLLQAQGQQRWRIGAQKDLTLVDGVPLKILQDFQPDREFVLEPGDMLYLPPHYAHEGVALGESMTCSIGFCAPLWQELGEAFLQFMAGSVALPGRYADPDLATGRAPAEISRIMLTRVSTEMNKMQFTADDVAIFLGEHLTTPKPAIFFDLPAAPLTAARFLQGAKKRGVALSRKTRMLYRGKHVFINGESFAAQAADKVSLHGLANMRVLEGEMVANASPDVMEALYNWYLDGWLDIGDAQQAGPARPLAS